MSRHIGKLTERETTGEGATFHQTERVWMCVKKGGKGRSLVTPRLVKTFLEISGFTCGGEVNSNIVTF